MNDNTRVYLITGFLGSGKTTFLNRIIDRFPRDKKLTILMNEFGEIGIDGTLVEGDAIDMMEISKGSIFCVCVKTDFIKGLYELDKKVKPDVLLIESTGVANPSDLKRDLRLPIFNDRFRFMEQFCLIDAAHFMDAFNAYASLEKQIASSTVFLINKTDLASQGDINSIKEVIGDIHPNPAYFETTFAEIPLDRFFPYDTPADGGQPTTTDPTPTLTEEELDRYIEKMLENPALEITPPDLLVSAVYQWRGTVLGQVRTMAENLPSTVVRAKGFVEAAGEMYLFSYVMGHWNIEKTNVELARIKNRNAVVFIGPPDAMNGVDQATKTGDWTSFGIFSPGIPRGAGSAHA